jgi:hypothetical protein
MRVQIQRQRGEIRQLQKAGIPTTSGEACASLRTWYDDKADNPPSIQALAEVRQLAPREAGATSTSKQSSCLLINTPKPRSATESSS